MNIRINAPWEVNAFLQQTIEEKVEKLATYYSRIIHADVFLKKGEQDMPEDKLVLIKLKIPGRELFAQHQSASYEKATAEVAEKLRRQIQKTKAKY